MQEGQVVTEGSVHDSEFANGCLAMVAIMGMMFMGLGAMVSGLGIAKIRAL